MPVHPTGDGRRWTTRSLQTILNKVLNQEKRHCLGLTPPKMRAKRTLKKRPDLFLFVVAIGLLSTNAAFGLPFRVSAGFADGWAPEKAVEGTLVLTPDKTGAGEASLPRRIRFTVPGDSIFDLPDTSWTASFEADGYWAEALPLAQQEAGAQLWLLPLGRVRGTMVLPPGEKPASELTLRVRSTPRPGVAPLLDATISCPVAEGRFDCVVPSGLLDLRLRKEPLAPAYAWGFRVPPGGTADLGSVQLRAGASVAGWVETADGGPLSPDCRVKLSPESADRGASPESDPALRGLILDTAVNERGFFQLTGVPPGSYVLSVASPGYAPIRVAPVQVRPALEAQVIDRLILARPVSVEIDIDPPHEPYGKTWQVELTRKASPSGPALETLRCQPSRDEGHCRLPGVAPGSYELVVSGEPGERWHGESLEVSEGSNTFDIRIPLIEIRGRVVQGNDDIAASLWFGRDGRSLRFDSDEEGRFDGLVPTEGIWDVDLQAGDSAQRLMLAPVEIRVPDGKSFAPVEIRIPDTTLSVEVVDDAGRPVPEARVTVAARRVRPAQGSRLQSSLHTVGPDGKLSIRGLPPGQVDLSASQGARPL